MNKDDLARIVGDLARTLRDEGALSDDTYIVNPLVVWGELCKRRPDAARHIERRYGGDPYQQTKVWIPRQLRVR